MSDVFPFLQLFSQDNAFKYVGSIINLHLHTVHEPIALQEGQYATSWLKEPKMKS